MNYDVKTIKNYHILSSQLIDYNIMHWVKE